MSQLARLRHLALALSIAATAAHAHVPPPAAVPNWRTQAPWSFEPWVVAALALSLTLYAIGLLRLWRAAGYGHGVRPLQAAAFLGGWLAVVLALVSPLDALGTQLFSAHMVQHEALMVLAAPLLVLGRPLAAWAWAFPAPWRPALGRWTRRPLPARLWQGLIYAPTAWALHGIALWSWHLPSWFEAALRHPGLHTVQHASFFVTALLFWWGPLGARERTGHGAALLYLFTTMMHTAALGALLTLSPVLWYGSYAATSAALGIDPLEDQQLGGLIMWVPAGLAYLFAGLAVMVDLLGGAGRRRRAMVP